MAQPAAAQTASWLPIAVLAAAQFVMVLASVGPAQTDEAGGLQSTAQNPGASPGAALTGAVGLAALANGVADRNPAVSPAVREEVARSAGATIAVVPVAAVEQAAPLTAQPG